MNIGFCNKYHVLAILALSLVCLNSFSQGFKVKEFKQNMNDGSAFHAPMDADGHPCGLVKVRTDDDKLQFGGNVVGQVENKMNEYWVFLSKGSNSLTIKHPNFMPTNVDFIQYGIEISPKATYILTLEPKKYKEKNCLVVTTMPNDASLYLNDVFVENLNGNGLYKLYLEKGDYMCRLEKKGYSKVVQAITIGKAPQNINAELESLMAELEVKCKTGTAEIYIDGEKKGNGSWKGSIYAGEHQIEARQQNFEKSTQKISIAEKETRTLVIPELKRSMGKLRIETTPNNLPINVDGKYVGMSPCTIDVETGNHYVSCKSYGLIPTRRTFIVNEGEESEMTIKMEYSTERDWLSDTYKKAYEGDNDAISELAETYVGWGYRENEKFYEEAVYWLEKYSHPEEFLIFEHWILAFCYVGRPEKALEIYPVVDREDKKRGGFGLSGLYMMYIGDAFFKKKEVDRAIQCYRISAENDEFKFGYGLEGLGDCYVAKGNKQLAANYYRKCLNLDSFDEKNRVEKKLKELGN